MKQRLLILFLALSFTLDAMAQVDAKSFAEYYSKSSKDFSEMRKKANAEFADYLKQAWEEFQVSMGKTDPLGNVPDKPEYYGEELSYFPSLPALPCPDVSFSGAGFPIMTEAISVSDMDAESVSIDCFGISTTIPFSRSLRISRVSAKEQDVSQGWSALSNADFMPTVQAIESFRDKYKFGDWAVYNIVKTITDAVYVPEHINEKILSQMFFLSQMKYKVKVGAAGNQLVLLLPFSSQIYQVPYINDSKDDYYMFSYERVNSQDPFYSFGDGFAIAENKIELVIENPISVSDDFYQLKMLSKWEPLFGESVAVPLNIPDVKFYLEYPQSDMLTYHNSKVDIELRKAVLKAFKYKLIKEDMSTEQAVSFMLKVVQKGFDYKSDIEMFGRTKPLFVEESFFYGSNNCKDRVLILSWLVKELLGLDVVAFLYQGHIALGINLPGDIKGDSHMYKGKRYVMCDPTYIGAPIGATMTMFRNVQPQIIEI